LQRHLFKGSLHLLRILRKFRLADEEIQILSSHCSMPELILRLSHNPCDTLSLDFILGDRAREVAARLVRSEYKEAARDLLNQSCSRTFSLHAQWPLNLTGTPLTFAILTKSTVAVNILLSLGALPTFLSQTLYLWTLKLHGRQFTLRLSSIWLTSFMSY
jgi:hypothetical protein